MAKEVSPELLEELKTYLETRERSAISLLSFYYKQVFSKELNIKCGGCIEDAVEFLKRILNKRKKIIVMGNFKWLGGKRTALVRQQGKVVHISESNFSDSYGELLYQIPKYAHLVEFVGGTPVGKSEPTIKGELKGIISIPKEQKKEEKQVKKKAAKQKLK